MGLDVWFRPDVARILGATFEAMQATAAAGEGGEQFESYKEGFGAALRAIAAGFGLPDPTLEAWRSQEQGACLEPRGYQIQTERAARDWRRAPADGRRWSSQVVDGEVLHTGRT